MCWAYESEGWRGDSIILGNYGTDHWSLLVTTAQHTMQSGDGGAHGESEARQGEGAHFPLKASRLNFQVGLGSGSQNLGSETAFGFLFLKALEVRHLGDQALSWQQPQSNCETQMPRRTRSATRNSRGMGTPAPCPTGGNNLCSGLLPPQAVRSMTSPLCRCLHRGLHCSPARSRSSRESQERGTLGRDLGIRTREGMGGKGVM